MTLPTIYIIIARLTAFFLTSPKRSTWFHATDISETEILGEGNLSLLVASYTVYN